MADVVEAKAKETLNHINDLLKQSPQPPLSDCANNYNAVLEGDIPQAKNALKTGNYKFAEQGSNDAANEADSCEKKFSTGTSPLTDSNKAVHDVGAVAAAIIRILL